MPLADAVIAATAFKEKATLISSEEHFKKIEEIKAKTPQEFLQFEYEKKKRNSATLPV